MKKASVLRTEFNFVAYMMNNNFTQHVAEDFVPRRRQVMLNEKAMSFLHRWRGSSSDIRQRDTARLDGMAAEWRAMVAAPAPSPIIQRQPPELVLPPGYQR